jgi:hypothetical protein
MIRLLAAIGVSIVAFFELCFTGRADYAWRLARSESNRNRASIFPSMHLALLLALVIITAAIVNNRSSIVDRNSLNMKLNRSVRAGPQRIELRPTATEEGKEPPARLIDGSARAAVIGCVIFSVIV